MNLAFKTILVATDFGGASELALQYAKILALRFDASIHLLHVIEEPFPMGAEIYVPELPKFREQLVIDSQRRLDEQVKSLAAANVTTHVAVGAPARTICDVASEKHADVIVMGTHGRGAVAHVIMGNVAERVVRTAPCPVLTVRERR